MPKTSIKHDDQTGWHVLIDVGGSQWGVGVDFPTEYGAELVADAIQQAAGLEHEPSKEAIESWRESQVPILTTAYTRNEPAPENLLCVEYTFYSADSEEGDGERPKKRKLWVGLDPDHGAPNIDAGRERLEEEGWEVTEWGAT
jgi:hypothetical protein